MKYDPTTRTIVLGRKDCGQCRYQEPAGTVVKRQDCPTCKGTGKGPRGGARGCKACFGFGNHYDHDVRETCPACKGDFKDAEEENYCDTAPVEALKDMPIRVVIVDRDSTWNERHLGMGTIWSTTDYGRTWDDAVATQGKAAAVGIWEDDLKAKVAKELLGNRVQSVKIVRSRDDLTIKDIILIKVTRGGYTVSAFDLTKEND